MATLTLAHGRRNSNTGRLERLSGAFSSNVPNKQYTEVFVTDCIKTVRINGKIYPGAHQVFSYHMADLAEANSKLNLSGDLFVYVRAKGQTDDYSNVYKLDKDKGYSDAGDLKQLKMENINKCAALIADINRQIGFLNSIADLINQILGRMLAADIESAIADKMAELAKEREELEKDLRKKQSYYDKTFGDRRKSDSK
jgi:hypothetical protein